MSGYATLKKVPNKKGVWYKIDIGECPVCGRCIENRTRMTGRKPKTYTKRVNYYTDYCGCLY